MTEKTISILGCGWLGFPLAKSFLQNGWQVKGSTTTPEKITEMQHAGIQPFLLDLNQPIKPEVVQEFVLNSDWLVVAIPPKTRNGEGEKYSEKIEKFLNRLEKKASLKAIFISSTSVYPDLNKVVTEDDTPESPNGNVLLQAEEVMKKNFGENLTIIRFAGLMGPGREPGKFLAGKTNVPNGSAPVNMIHLQDCIGIITAIINQNCLGQIFNASADEHPTRKDFFTKAALGLGLIPPVFSEEPAANFKEISSEKVRNILNYTFQFPDPLALV